MGDINGSLAIRLQWHTIAVIHFTFFLFPCSSLLCCQAAQLAYVIDDRLKEAVEVVDREKAPVATAKDKGNAAEATEKRA